MALGVPPHLHGGWHCPSEFTATHKKLSPPSLPREARSRSRVCSCCSCNAVDVALVVVPLAGSFTPLHAYRRGAASRLARCADITSPAMADAGRHSQPVSAPWQRSSVEPVSKPSGQWLRVAEYATYFVVVAATILLLAPPFSRHLRQECHRSPRCRYWLRPTFLDSTPLGAVVVDTDVADSQWRDLRTSAPELLGECTFTVVVCTGSC